MSRSINYKVNLCSTRMSAVLGILTSFICFGAATAEAGEREMKETHHSCSCSTRELWTVLYGAGATVVALLLCVGQWERCLINQNGEERGYVSPAFNRFAVLLFKILLPQVCVPWVLTAGYAAILLRQRLMNIAPEEIEKRPGLDKIRKSAGLIAKRLCPMVVWIGIDAETYNSFFDDSPAPHSDDQTSTGSAPVQSTVPRDDDAELQRGTVKELFDIKQRFKQAPNLKIAIPWPAGSKPPPPAEGDHETQHKTYYYLCLQGWDKKGSMWKEAMVVTGALGADHDEIGERMGMVNGWGWWARVLLVVQGLGYLASVLSRFVHHSLRVSPLEVMCAWISVVVVVEAGIMPLIALPSHQGIHLRLDPHQFRDVLLYYIDHRHTRVEQLTCLNLWSFVLCILSTFSLYLIVMPPLIYYYYKLPTSILSFVSLILFAILTGAGIVSLALMLFSPPHQVALAFVDFCRPPSSTCMLVLTLCLVFTGLASYSLVITDTTMNWPLFETRDRSFFRFIIPHIGS